MNKYKVETRWRGCGNMYPTKKISQNWKVVILVVLRGSLQKENRFSEKHLLKNANLLKYALLKRANLLNNALLKTTKLLENA